MHRQLTWISLADIASRCPHLCYTGTSPMKFRRILHAISSIAFTRRSSISSCWLAHTCLHHPSAHTPSFKQGIQPTRRSLRLYEKKQNGSRSLSALSRFL
jgi:hypothetical protein